MLRILYKSRWSNYSQIYHGYRIFLEYTKLFFDTTTIVSCRTFTPQTLSNSNRHPNRIVSRDYNVTLYIVGSSDCTSKTIGPSPSYRIDRLNFSAGADTELCSPRSNLPRNMFDMIAAKGPEGEFRLAATRHTIKRSPPQQSAGFHAVESTRWRVITILHQRCRQPIM